jgi:hypothetical protein
MPQGLPAEGDTVLHGAASAAATTRRARAPETGRLYQADWQAFVAWCATRNHRPLPAAPAAVAAFLTEAATKLGAGALGRRAAAIGQRHRACGLVSPAADPAVRAVLAAARRAAAPAGGGARAAARRAAAPRRPPPPPPGRLIRLAASCPGDLAGLRDRALLLLAAAGLSRAALVGLDVEHLRFGSKGVELAVQGEDANTVRRLVIPRGATLAMCPVHALDDWLRTSGTEFGPVFRKVDRWNNVEQRRLGTDALRRILARRTRRRRHRPRPPPA